MSVHPQFDNATPAIKSVKSPPIVLCFGPLKPKQLPRFSMHDRRSGGDLDHVDLSLKTLNRIEHGDESWIPKLKRQIENMAKRNLKNEVRALKEKGRVAEAKRRHADGPKNPWHANTDAPLREGILTVNKLWFGGTGAREWDQSKVDAFRAYAIDFLTIHFPRGQLVYAASHCDEEAFHIHFVTATWDMTTTANRGQQIQLRAAANPILRSYEHAQDLAGDYFEAIGITRGERLAEARREAKAAGLPVPEKRYHVPPSEYRAAERRKGSAEADVIIEKAVADCGVMRLGAATVCAVALKKTRKRALRSERKAMRETLRSDAKLNRVRSEIVDATLMLEKTQAARNMVEATKAAATDTARQILEDARETGTKTLRMSRVRATKDALARSNEADRQVKAAEGKRALAEQAASVARDAETAARVREQRAQACAFELGRMATDAEEDFKQARTNKDAALDELKITQVLREAALVAAHNAKASEAAAKQVCKGIASGLEYLVADVIRYSPQSETRSEGLTLSKGAPIESDEIHTVKANVKPVRPLLIQLAKMIHTAVGLTLARDRSKIAADIDTLSEIRRKMGIMVNDDLEQIRARHERRSEDPALHAM